MISPVVPEKCDLCRIWKTRAKERETSLTNLNKHKLFDFCLFFSCPSSRSRQFTTTLGMSCPRKQSIWTSLATIFRKFRPSFLNSEWMLEKKGFEFSKKPYFRLSSLIVFVGLCCFFPQIRFTEPGISGLFVKTEIRMLGTCTLKTTSSSNLLLSIKKVCPFFSFTLQGGRVLGTGRFCSLPVVGGGGSTERKRTTKAKLYKQACVIWWSFMSWSDSLNCAKPSRNICCGVSGSLHQDHQELPRTWFEVLLVCAHNLRGWESKLARLWTAGSAYGCGVSMRAQRWVRRKTMNEGGLQAWSPSCRSGISSALSVSASIPQESQVGLISPHPTMSGATKPSFLRYPLNHALVHTGVRCWGFEGESKVRPTPSTYQSPVVPSGKSEVAWRTWDQQGPMRKLDRLCLVTAAHARLSSSSQVLWQAEDALAMWQEMRSIGGLMNHRDLQRSHWCAGWNDTEEVINASVHLWIIRGLRGNHLEDRGLT